MSEFTLVTYGFRLTAEYWDPGYDPNDPMSANTPDASQFDEKSYWYASGELDGVKGYINRVELIPPGFQFDYNNGYNDGLWKGKIFRQN